VKPGAIADTGLASNLICYLALMAEADTELHGLLAQRTDCALHSLRNLGYRRFRL
jgi:hypothetical protein